MNFFLALLMAVTAVLSKASSTCDNVKLSYLNGALYMVAKASYDFTGKPKDCADLLHMGNRESGVYEIWPTSRLYDDDRSFKVYCDMKSKGGGWTMIQERGDYGQDKDLFNQDWNAYKKGFGDLNKEFWLGNDKIFAISNQKLYTLRVYLEDMEGDNKYAEYDTFWIDDENHDYMLHISGYRGDAGDGLTNHHNNQKFSTKDKDNDNSKDYNCANSYQGGWWFNECLTSNLNGVNLRGKHESKGGGISWIAWKGQHYSLKSAQTKIRPRNFKPPSDT